MKLSKLRRAFSIGFSLLLFTLLTLGFQNFSVIDKPRMFHMGFDYGASPLNADPNGDILAQNTVKNEMAFELWSQVADATISHPSVPWKTLISRARKLVRNRNLAFNVAADKAAKEVVDNFIVPQVQKFRDKGYFIVYTIDPLNGLDRSKLEPPPELRELNLDLDDTESILVYSSFVSAIAQLVKPDYLGLATEVNFFNGNCQPNRPCEFFDKIKSLTKAGHDRIVSDNGFIPKFFIGINIDKPHFQLMPGVFPIDKQDFPFIDAVGVTAYPGLWAAQPGDVPKDYLSKPTSNLGLPILVVESGWPSNKAGEGAQRRWVKRFFDDIITDYVIFVSQLIFTDFDPGIVRPPSIVELFGQTGIVHFDLTKKPAFQIWKKNFKRPFHPKSN